MPSKKKPAPPAAAGGAGRADAALKIVGVAREIRDDIEAMLGINREVLGYIPEERGGEVCGPLTVIDRDPGSGEPVRIDCARLGTGAWSIPSRVEHLAFESRAKFVLVVETSSLFQRLVHHRWYEKAKCVLISISGVPTRACRRFVRRLADASKLPVLAFTDGDPYGYCNIYEWQNALNQMLKMGVRIEQQAFAKHGLNHVMDVYLPDKLKKARYLP